MVQLRNSRFPTRESSSDSVVLYPRVRLFFKLGAHERQFPREKHELNVRSTYRPDTECPSETEWLPLAAGLLPEAQIKRN